MILSKLLTSSIAPLHKSCSFMSFGCHRLLRGEDFWGMIRRGGAAAGSMEATGYRALPASHEHFALQKPQPITKEQIPSGLAPN